MDLFLALLFSRCSELNLGIFFLGIFQQSCGEIQVVVEEQIHKKASSPGEANGGRSRQLE